jgi:hypothetical protein
VGIQTSPEPEPEVVASQVLMISSGVQAGDRWEVLEKKDEELLRLRGYVVELEEVVQAASVQGMLVEM